MCGAYLLQRFELLVARVGCRPGIFCLPVPPRLQSSPSNILCACRGQSRLGVFLPLLRSRSEEECLSNSGSLSPFTGGFPFPSRFRISIASGTLRVARSSAKECLSSEGREFFSNGDINELIQGHAFLFGSPTRFFEQGGLKPEREITLFHLFSSSVSVLPGESRQGHPRRIRQSRNLCD